MELILENLKLYEIISSLKEIIRTDLQRELCLDPLCIKQTDQRYCRDPCFIKQLQREVKVNFILIKKNEMITMLKDNEITSLQLRIGELEKEKESLKSWGTIIPKPPTPPKRRSPKKKTPKTPKLFISKTKSTKITASVLFDNEPQPKKIKTGLICQMCSEYVSSKCYYCDGPFCSSCTYCQNQGGEKSTDKCTQNKIKLRK